MASTSDSNLLSILSRFSLFLSRKPLNSSCKGRALIFSYSPSLSLSLC